VGTREGELWRRWKGAWIAETNHPQTHAITAIVEDREGWMWIGTEGGGLERFKGDERVHFDKTGGLLSDLIRTLYMDGQGVVWIGTAGGGLSRWRDGRIATFTTREGLPDNTVSQILEDHAGRLWLGSNRGIACVNKNELEELAAGRIPAVYPQVYGRTEGMPSEECTGGFSPAGLKTKSGLLWFSTLKGIVVADPSPHTASAAIPPVALEEVLLDGVPDAEFRVPAPAVKLSGKNTPLVQPELEMLHIRPGKHRIEFRYTGMSFDAPERVRFRYRLDGLDPDWVEAGTHRSALYSYVPPGHYTFRVIACNSDGPWDEAGAALALTVLPHFWQAWWVIGLGCLAALVLVGSTVRLVEKRKLQHRLKRLEQEGALERERTRIAQDLHDEMGAKLCRISFLSEHARRHELVPAELRHQISSISDASREVLCSLDEIVWAVNPQNDTLEHLVSYIGQYAQEYFQETGIECELHIPTQLPPQPLSSQIRHHLLLAVHEAFTNMLKHSGATRARVSITCNKEGLEIVAWDNGRSFDPSMIANGLQGAANGSGNGLRNMRSRLTEIGGHCQVKSEPGQGTTIRFVLPLGGMVYEG
jgi:signal transduction histidine kinase